MEISRGLVIAEPWIDHILEGRKDWEMRSTATSVRGWFGLIRKGSGQVEGLARLVGCGTALSQADMIAHVDRHRIPEKMIRSGTVAKWTIPWKLADIVRLEEPVPYEHKSGAVSWVSLSHDVQKKLSTLVPQHGATDTEPHVLRTPTDVRQKPTENVKKHRLIGKPTRGIQKKPAVGPISNAEEMVLGRTRLTSGNLRNNHFYLTEFLAAFPRDTIGGRNRSEAADRELSIDWGGPHPVSSDIDATKRMFRRRGWVGNFFSAANAQEGDTIVVVSASPYQVRVYLEHAAFGNE
ncbi:hypothetical protein [Roseovarius spongiae]|uniref:hypothetical protein n=1 Tax=Roseovarius spongiae TaxID=2320272 RepID=UPI0011C46855|nr:hypothetical protein [Roseovarius spongiae]